ncbi:arginyl-tRNA--protein transferase 1 isoform X2 [Condylostylus longicornis]|uniref:arginyl-tRNA--protein transferase 1 isoform X2 n=1 Tax=Condylostylus longicornis TaxID=2530218 RepID=UPI00244DAF04|nr:arginyl-tRNA--protein transferase 1 isoform X2 [Condylostylus longicornis]
MTTNLSVIEYYGEQNRKTCGYCKGSKSCFSHGMHAYAMTTQDYQDLIDRGWRRSGEYCYKPNNKITCCPSYTIKCDTEQFKLSKSQKKILKRMSKFLKDGIKNASGESSSKVDAVENCDLPNEIVEIPDIARREINSEDIANVTKQINPTCDIALKRFKYNAKDFNPKENNEKSVTDLNKDHIKKPSMKAKQIRLERKKAKLESRGLSLESERSKLKNQEKSLNDFIHNPSESDRHKLKILLVPSQKGSTPQVLDLYQKYQVTIHKDPPHKITKFQFERFLCATPLKNYKPENGPADGYGSFHQQYWLDDKLIAVGVVDILPYCVSSVYFFYDPDYSFLSLGTYGSLREIELVKKLSETVPLLKYYYMGFYIHSCPKMKYKGKLTASYLLCPEKYSWHLLTDEIKEKLEQKKYQVFNNDVNFKDEEEFTRNDLNEVLILFQKNSYASYLEFKQIKSRNYDREILEYGNLVGKSCAHRMLFLAF